MLINKIFLQDFRSWNELNLELKKGVNVFIAPNGSGKTNVVEAIYFLSTLQSHRTSDYKQLIKFKQPEAILKVEVEHDKRKLLFGASLSPTGGKKFSINDNWLKKQAEYLGFFRTVIFSPEDLQLIKGEPQLRRKLLDEILIVFKPDFVELKRNYDKVLKQKNALLKQSFNRNMQENFASTLRVWNEKIADFGAKIILYRLDLLKNMVNSIGNNYEIIANKKGKLNIEYKPSFTLSVDNLDDLSVEEIKTNFLQAIELAEPEELQRGTSLIGPHREDFVLTLDQNPVKYFASHGETWSAAISLKLGVKKLHQTAGFNPIIILDDVFAELDVERRKRLIQLLQDSDQVLITTAVATDIPQELEFTKHQISMIERNNSFESILQ